MCLWSIMLHNSKFISMHYCKVITFAEILENRTRIGVKYLCKAHYLIKKTEKNTSNND